MSASGILLASTINAIYYLVLRDGVPPKVMISRGVDYHGVRTYSSYFREGTRGEDVVLVGYVCRLHPFFLKDQSNRRVGEGFYFFRASDRRVRRNDGLKGRRRLVSTVRHVLGRLRTRLRLKEVPFMSFVCRSQVATSLPRPHSLYGSLRFEDTGLHVQLRPGRRTGPFHVNLVRLLLLTFRQKGRVFFRLVQGVLRRVPLRSPRRGEASRFLRALRHVKVAMLRD